jgi:hypothetical protein
LRRAPGLDPQKTFSVVRAWLGDVAFEAAAAIHIDRMPPSSWTLDAFAQDSPGMFGAAAGGDLHCDGLIARVA